MCVWLVSVPNHFLDRDFDFVPELVNQIASKFRAVTHEVSNKKKDFSQG